MSYSLDKPLCQHHFWSHCRNTALLYIDQIHMDPLLIQISPSQNCLQGFSLCLSMQSIGLMVQFHSFLKMQQKNITSNENNAPCKQHALGYFHDHGMYLQLVHMGKISKAIQLQWISIKNRYIFQFPLKSSTYIYL